jgi:hypothetical protein
MDGRPDEPDNQLSAPGETDHEENRTMPQTYAVRVGLMLLPLMLTAPATAGPGEALAKRIREVGREGKGNVEAAKAWKELVALGPSALVDALTAIEDDELVSANWLRTAAEAICDKEDKLSPEVAKQVEAFVRETRHARIARRAAYELLTKADPAAPRRLLPTMLRDPSPELRRDAIAMAFEEVEKTKRDYRLPERRDALALLMGPLTTVISTEAFATETERRNLIAAYLKALSGACDQDQVETAAKALRALGREVDLASHFGFVRRWHLITPFDNSGGAGYKAEYPPEKDVDLKAVCKGKGDAEARWGLYVTKDAHGKVDLNAVLGKKKGVVAYGYAVVDSPKERLIEVRAGTQNAVKIYLNGKEIVRRDEYHHGMLLDQHVGRGTLKAGRNTILIKVCQNEQTDSWAQEWSFQLRLCDVTGVRVPFTEPDKE